MKSRKIHCTCVGHEEDFILVTHSILGRIFVEIREDDRVSQVVLTRQRAKQLRKQLKEALAEAKGL